MKNLKELQFDQYSRQKLVSQLIESIREKDSLSILDVGGYLGNTDKFFPKDTVTVVDLYDVEQENYVKGNALALPFDDDSFDVVVSFDVFEHIAKQDRRQFVNEMCRVSKDIISVAAPFDTEFVAESEEDANNLFKLIYKKNHPWLIEHIENKLPSLTKTETYFNENQVNYRVYASNNILLWKMMMGFMFMCGDSRLPELSFELNEFYNENAQLLGDNSEPSYRKVLFGRKNQVSTKGLPDIHSVIDNQTNVVFIEKIISGIAQIIADKELSIEQAAALKLSDYRVIKAENKTLRKEIQAIKGSRAWKLASILRKLKTRL